MKGEELEQIITFMPAFDKRDNDPAKNYGIGAVRCLMILKGRDAAVHFVFSTGMFLPDTIQEYAAEGRLTPHKMEYSGKYFLLNVPMGFDVGYHVLHPQFEGQTVSQKACDWIGKRPCYSDGSAIRAETFMDVLLKDGSDAVWKMLREEYKALSSAVTKKQP